VIYINIFTNTLEMNFGKLKIPANSVIVGLYALLTLVYSKGKVHGE